jgi:glutaredoxin
MGIDLELLDRVLQRARCFVTAVSSVVQRTEIEQQHIDEQTGQLMLYEMPACPYCCKVRRRIHKLGLNVPTRDVCADDDAYNTLVAATQSSQVPCLHISAPGKEPRWLFESNDIVTYLEDRFGETL